MAELNELSRNTIQDIASQLEETNWTVETEPVVSGLQPDLIARQGDHTLVIELKLGTGSASVSSLVYLTKVQASLQESLGEEGQGQVVECVLVTNETVPDAVLQTAREVNVDIIQVHPSSSTEVAREVREHLSPGIGPAGD